jgi:hypothetical protein
MMGEDLEPIGMSKRVPTLEEIEAKAKPKLPYKVERMGELHWLRPWHKERYEALIAKGELEKAEEYKRQVARPLPNPEEIEADRKTREEEYQARLRDSREQVRAIVDGIEHRRRVAEANAQAIKRPVSAIKRLLEE